ncbi:MAG TPA: sulfite exporter TauE/SafE family protein [Rhabdaerophilum sp.]|nr:sulfite exporter TauE/SafE family protein [Rhabdaerophilum sp.]
MTFEPEPHIARLSPRMARLLALALAALVLAFVVIAASQETKPFHVDAVTFAASFAVGLLAQIVDGALGMGYGVTSNSLLLASGLPPAAATATVHVAKSFTGAASGLSHWKLGNVDKRIFGRLILPGIIGTLFGVHIVTSIDGNTLRPWISAYLLAMGIFILIRAFRTIRFASPDLRRLFPVAFIGGFADSVGGGGWGPVVTTTLVGSGHEPRTTIGSVNAAEFVISLASGLSFTMLIGIQHWESVAGLVLGGVVIAPFAARLTHRLDRHTMMIAVGLLVSGLSLFSIFRACA